MFEFDLAVIGLGYVGMPLACEASVNGLRVVGVDVDGAVVDDLRAGRSPVRDVTDADLRLMRGRGFTATTSGAPVAVAKTVVICVPTPLDTQRQPDMSAVRSAARLVAAHLSAGSLVVLESTVRPGATDEVVRPILEESGLVAGVDFHLAFSPERIDPGNAEFGLRNTPKVVGGHTPACTAAAEEFYAQIVDKVVVVRGTREAEMVKLLENTYRYVNIGLVNEMLMLSGGLGVDFWEVVDAAATKPFGFQAFAPGPGVGGHCIPVDPMYLSHRLRELGHESRFIDVADRVNEEMPHHVARRVTDLLSAAEVDVSGASVALLGVTYKQDVADVRESPAVPLVRCLRAAGATVGFHDPYVDEMSVDGTAMPAFGTLADVSAADIVVVLQQHQAYLGDELRGARRVLDTRGFLRGDNVVRL